MIHLVDPENLVNPVNNYPRQLIPDSLSITPPWIRRPQSHTRFLFNHDPFSIAEITELSEFVPSRRERSLRVARQPKRLTHKFIG